MLTEPADLEKTIIERRPRSPQLEKRPHSEEDPAQPKRKYPVKEETLLDKWLHLDLDLDCIEI